MHALRNADLTGSAGVSGTHRLYRHQFAASVGLTCCFRRRRHRSVYAADTAVCFTKEHALAADPRRDGWEPAAQPAAGRHSGRSSRPTLPAARPAKLDDAQRISVRHLGALLAPVENRVRRSGDLILMKTGQLRRHIMCSATAWSAPYVDLLMLVMLRRTARTPCRPKCSPHGRAGEGIGGVDTAITPLA